MKFQIYVSVLVVTLLSACGISPATSDLEVKQSGRDRNLTCNFADENNRVLYTVKGDVSSDGILKVALITGGIQKENADKDINNNPIKPTTAKNGGSAYFIDALADDPDFGDTFTLTLPKVLGKGSMPATIEHVYYSRNPRAMGELVGSCILD